MRLSSSLCRLQTSTNITAPCCYHHHSPKCRLTPRYYRIHSSRYAVKLSFCLSCMCIQSLIVSNSSRKDFTSIFFIFIILYFDCLLEGGTPNSDRETCSLTDELSSRRRHYAPHTHTHTRAHNTTKRFSFYDSCESVY